MINFNIAQWRAWAPGLDSAQDWLAWSKAPVVLPASDAAPDVSFLPAMQRRRLSRLARMAFSVGWPLAEGLQDLPLVFISRHGETPRTLDILSDLADGQPLSPTQFSLSVHNAVIGLWSILRNETSEMTALAAALNCSACWSIASRPSGETMPSLTSARASMRVWWACIMAPG